MLILPEEINKLLLKAGNSITNRGKKYFEQNRVRIKKVDYTNDTNYNVGVLVDGTYFYKVNISKNNGKITYNCNCPCSEGTNLPCKHVIATLFDMYVNKDIYVNFREELKFTEQEKGKMFNNSNILLNNTIEIKNDIINYYEKLDTKNNNTKKLRLVPKIEIFGLKNVTFSVSFKIGTNRLYVIKDIYEFGNLFLSKAKVKYGKEFEVIHDIDQFDEESKKIVDFVCTKTNEYRYFNRLNNNFSIDKMFVNKLVLNYGALDEFFDILNGKHIEISGYFNTNEVCFVDENPKLDFEIIEKNDNIIIKDLSLGEYCIYRGQKYDYILYRGKLYRCSNDYSKTVIFLLKQFLANKNDEVMIPLNEATSFCEYVLPNLKNHSNVICPSSFVEKHKAQNMLTKVYLDLDEKGNIVADVNFCYQDQIINPFKNEENNVVNRNRLQEQKALQLINNNKFNLDKTTGKVYISREEDIYDFMNEGINSFMEKFEVLATDKFKSRNVVKSTPITLGLRIKNDLLEIDIEDLEFDQEELANIIKNYRLKKRFYRLKDGRFVNIDSSGIDTLIKIAEDMSVNVNELLKHKLKVPKYRALYVDDVIGSSEDINARKDTSYKEVIRNILYAKDIDFNLPTNMENILREYQKVGYSWLKTIDSLGFGGILADDMGLGKTIQVISLFQKELEENRQTSIVVCPSSLYINWEKEINRFAPDLKVLVVSGNANKRKKLIAKTDEYDVVITSYDLLKRDIEEYQSFKFRYIIADEAQYIKNNNTKNKKALKRINGKTCFALTGTPMENSLSELWSIFDFCMPGYLFSYSKFKDNIESRIIKDEDKEATEKLNKLVSPFILRRTKKEVLKELPDKTETVMYNEMSEKQEKVYKAYLAKAKNIITQEIDEKGLQKSKVKILALITRLRQICCHPSLFIENYDGESAKLEQCIQLIEDACGSSHKILLFSQFTSIFNLLKSELKKRNINYYELTGKTKADTRVQLVDSFNKDENVKVFLISLKAGGTGLNLIGADMVIHFDPWWNLSVKNQATDRAHRIGQKNNVQVFSLITQNSIEEKIAKLQEKKQNLADNVIKPGETFISKMSKEEILNLFE